MLTFVSAMMRRPTNLLIAYAYVHVVLHDTAVVFLAYGWISPSRCDQAVFVIRGIIFNGLWLRMVSLSSAFDV
jgi:hypothetical protein